ncbi:serine/threonine-protein kinase [Humidisolicoccus flavus]|uniref:serine/threonine-protein kinase n=1 Tax=Humidisolicoccus flavus TaxID=3111414 RepID=UPI003245AEDF
MARRLPSSPPVLPGFAHLHIVGTGGFADVFLYEQNMPRRPVAVKVMLADFVDDAVRTMFQSEVNLMGQLSAHPNILTVYEASVSSDGRPYIVMELCSAQVGSRFRETPYSVAESLDMMIRIGSALETAHQAGTLHRDVKPANIMTTAYGHPVLSDFGIAGSSQAEVDAQIGVSVPWSAPEVLREETAGTIATEVFAFGATLYSLLAGRSPAEIPDRLNGTAQLVDRITSNQLQPLHRDDVPAELERIIKSSLAPRPGDRPQSIYQMLVELQNVQRALDLPVTSIEVTMDPWTVDVVPEASDNTVAAPMIAERPKRPRRRAHIERIDLSTQAEVRETSLRTRQHTHEEPRKQLILGAAIGVGTVLVLAIIGVAVIAFSTLAGGIPRVEAIDAQQTSGAVEFTWKDPGMLDTDSYLVRTSNNEAMIQRTNEFTMTGVPGEEVCVEVAVNREGSTGESITRCAEVLP